MVEYYEEAEEYLEHIADDIPLFTNTVEGVFSEGARTAPAPLETNSDLFVSPMRAQLARRRANLQAPPDSSHASQPHTAVSVTARTLAQDSRTK